MENNYLSVSTDKVKLNPGLFRQRFDVNRNYLAGLKTENLLQNYYAEAGMGAGLLSDPAVNDMHGGLESPVSHMRGHFAGQWLSAASRIVASTGDPELKAKIDIIVAELAKCQERNGDSWVFSIPEKYFDWAAAGIPAGAPHYVVSKTLMGLLDAYKLTSNSKAMSILRKAANWFQKWTAKFSAEEMESILEIETGGMLEFWADLYSITKAGKHLELMERYTRSRLFEALLAGQDALTNMQAATMIPEINGAAKAYEVTGDERWRNIVEKFWDIAVTNRGGFCTGGQTTDGAWNPPFEFAARRGDKTQEFSAVFNMIRLAEYLFRWTGDAKYADYIERNLYNGMLAQQNSKTGMVSCYLPMEAGGKKSWSHLTNDFRCSLGAMVQAQTLYNDLIYYTKENEIAVAQFIPSVCSAIVNEQQVIIDMKIVEKASEKHRPDSLTIEIRVNSEEPVEFVLKIRLPWWVKDKPALYLNNEKQSVKTQDSFIVISRQFQNDVFSLELPKGLSMESIPDEPDIVAFMDGPVVLAGLYGREYILKTDKKNLNKFLVPDNELENGAWSGTYRTKGQVIGIRFKPLFEIADEQFTIYFPVR